MRFAVPPLDVAGQLLFLRSHAPGWLQPAWRARATDVLVEQGLGLLAVVGARGTDFLLPEPDGFQPGLDGALHRLATTPAARVRYDLADAFAADMDAGSGRRPPRVYVQALERGEDHFAHRLADEMERFWRAALAREWPGIRTRLEADVAERASAVAHHGLADTLSRLAHNLEWREGTLTVHLPPGVPFEKSVDADGLVLMPSVFTPRAVVKTADLPGAPDPRTPQILYPAGPAECPVPSGELIGATRATILAELSQPRSTSEIAQRVHLSPATVSYHLQILHRAGIVTRRRRSHHVLYQRL
ncbi:ArsR/SmtB family transcription factor [Streptacidiphilus anmyonensis]|uniref:ArsR/SmtB family transcription factor n=1 Tax=Streptacidiphilus anmyonensis TaxID=405782 RepID=UPI000694F4C5|nr:helix-turn-helix domain-containing protein [Streptacidiphilus anmyonensis]